MAEDRVDHDIYQHFMTDRQRGLHNADIHQRLFQLGTIPGQASFQHCAIGVAGGAGHRTRSAKVQQAMR